MLEVRACMPGVAFKNHSANAATGGSEKAKDSSLKASNYTGAYAMKEASVYSMKNASVYDTRGVSFGSVKTVVIDGVVKVIRGNRLEDPVVTVAANARKRMNRTAGILNGIHKKGADSAETQAMLQYAGDGRSLKGQLETTMDNLEALKKDYEGDIDREVFFKKRVPHIESGGIFIDQLGANAAPVLRKKAADAHLVAPYDLEKLVVRIKYRSGYDKTNKKVPLTDAPAYLQVQEEKVRDAYDNAVLWTLGGRNMARLRNRARSRIPVVSRATNEPQEVTYRTVPRYLEEGNGDDYIN